MAYECKVRGSYPHSQSWYENLVVDVGFRHKKVARPKDVATWNFPPGMLDFGSDSGADDDDEGGLESDIELLVDSLLN